MIPRLLAGALAVGLLLGACGGDDPASVDAADAREVGELDAGVPTRLAGLRVTEEDITDTLKDSRRPYLDGAALYAFRADDDELQATLQVGRFADDVDVDDEEFRKLVITSIGASAREVRMGDRQLHLTGADRQTLAIWFESRHLFILSTRDGFESGRTLLREALEIRP